MTSTLARPSPTAAMTAASAQGTSAMPAAGCRDCVKQGLAILPVVPTPIPLALRGKSAEINALDNRFAAPDLQAHWLALRTLPSGYLYVMKPDLTWDVYVVDGDGMLRMMAPADAPASPAQQAPLSALCKRAGDNVPAQVIAIDPSRYATVWLAFSRYRWTANVMRDYAANVEGCRDRRMSKLDVMAAAAGSLGSASKAANAVRFGVPMGTDVGTVVADYASAATRSALNAQLVTPVRQRGEQATALAAKMAAISRNTQGKTGAIIALSDDLGIAMDVNALRNAETGRMAAYMLAHQRERMVGDIILGFEKSFKDNQQGAEWTKRYAKHYNGTKLLSDKSSYEAKVGTWNKSIAALSADVAVVIDDSKLKPCWRDFDPKDDQSARDRQDATARCLHGAVKTKAEHALWDKWFEESPADPYATLWGAVTALDTSFGAFMVGKVDKGVDVIKNLRDARENYRELAQKRADAEALALMGAAMASQLGRLQMTNAALYRVAGMRVLMVASMRTSVTITPVSMEMTQTQQAMMMAEATFGPPKAELRRLLDIEQVSGKRTFVVGTNGVDSYAFESTTTVTQRARVVEMWLPDEVASQLRLPAAATQRLLPPPRINPFEGLVRYTKSTPGVLAWIGLTLQVMNLGNSLKDLQDPKVGDKTDANFGLVSGTLGVTGVMAEITAGAMQKMVTRFATNAFAKVAFGGGVLAAGSAIVDSIQAASKAVDRSRAGDGDAAFAYATASFFLAASGIAGLGGAFAVGSAAGAFTGVLGFLAPIGAAAATIPVWGWIAAGVIFLAIGVAALWYAIRDTDNPMEEWLKGSLYGVGPKRFTGKEEMDALNGVVYAMSVEVEWSGDAWEWRNTEFWDDYDNFKFSISLPGAGANSVIDCKVTLIGGGKTQTVFHETIRPHVIGTRVIDPHIPMMGPASPQSPRMPRYIWWEPPAIRQSGERGVRYGGQLKLDDDLYSEAQVQISYWPDQQSMPNFVLPGPSERMLIGKS